ncbi:MFS transporter [Halobacillus naozhouensis]|uniref:MFS transporter n=1 Tax=Halobacillus naozhouensis TaxID=554880 RepID=A0ABY8IXS1_9BACI|nr:MFS transporter [Halobacillus naozhouensis]WFT73974.1 MFS transporter [Halobacillus naozhouensis]
MTRFSSKPWLLVVTIGLGTLLNPLNSSMISVAVTRLQHEFDLTFADASWLISIFYIASAAAQPVMGKLSDMFGPKRLFLTGLVLVAATSLLAPFSPRFQWLLVYRALQAIGSSTLFPSGMTMIRTSITKGQGKALGTIAVFASTSAASGPSIAGFLIDWWDWPAIFLINLPFIILSFVLAIFVLPKKGQGKAELSRIDFIGMGLFTTGTVCLILFFLSLTNEIKWWALPAALAALTVFYSYEKRQKEPFIDLVSLKSNVPVTWIYIQFMTINLIYYCYFFGLPTFLQQVRHYSGKETGLIMLAMAGVGVMISPVAGRWIDQNGSKPPLLSGAVTLFIGTALLLTLHETSPLWGLLIIMAVLGVSNGFNKISMQTALYDHVKPEETGSASGLFQTSRYYGSILSTCLLGIVFTGHMDIQHLHSIAGICLIFCLFVLVLAVRHPRLRK